MSTALEVRLMILLLIWKAVKVMSRIEEIIKEKCPDGVEYKELGSVIEITKGIQFNKENMNDEGTYPVINGGINPSGYIEQYNNLENTITISQGGASAGFVNWITTKFWAGAHCYVVKPLPIVDVRYIYHFLKSQEYKLKECQYGAGIPALSKATVTSLEIPVPPLEIQCEIVRILDKITELEAELQAELDARKKQYEYYKDFILSRSDKVETVRLDVVCGIYDGTHQTPKYIENGVPFVSVENIDDLNGTTKYISYEAYQKFKIKPQIGDVFMTRITAGVIGKCAVVSSNDDMAYYVSLALLRPDVNKLNSYYLKYYLESSHGKRELAKRILWNATPTKINKDDIGKVLITIPSIEVQEEIVQVLDCFDTICNDSELGLPAEIEARHKQYEYYRDKLLTFERKVV